MASKPAPELSINSWLQDELYRQYLNDQSTVDQSWKDVFEESSPPLAPAAPAVSAASQPPAPPEPPAGGQLQPLPKI